MRRRAAGLRFVIAKEKYRFLSGVSRIIFFPAMGFALKRPLGLMTPARSRNTMRGLFFCILPNSYITAISYLFVPLQGSTPGQRLCFLYFAFFSACQRQTWSMVQEQDDYQRK